MKKKIGLIIGVALLILSLTGCGKGASEGKSEDYKNYVYKVNDFAAYGEDMGFNQILMSGETMYGCGYHWMEDGTGAYMFFSEILEDGSYGGEHRIPMSNDNNFFSMSLDEENNLYLINNTYSAPEESSEDYVDTYYLEKRTMDGEVLFSVKLNDIPQIKELANEYFYVSNMIRVPGQGIYLSVFGNLVKFDMDGNFQKVIAPADEDARMAIESGFVQNTGTDGMAIAVVYSETGMSLGVVNLEAGTLEKKCKIPGNGYEYSFYKGMGYDLYLVNSYGVYGYNIGEEDKTQLMSYLDSDCGFYNIYNVVPLSETEFLAMYNTFDGVDQVLARFTKVPPQEVVEKQVITLATTWNDYEITKAVLKFNKENDQYRISVQDYASLYGSDEDYMAGTNRLNTDIVSGKVPDIILLDNRMPIDSYISKGLFEDLMPYIEKDGQMSPDDFMPNVIEAFSVNGKLYRLVPKYSIQTMVAKTSEVGAVTGWTVPEALEIWKTKPEGTEFVSQITRDNMMWECLAMSSGQFVDPDTGKCNFNSEEFIQMLEFFALFPEEIEVDSFDDEYWMNYESMWREGKVLTSIISIGDFRNYNYMEKATFGEDITIVGFPSGDRNGSALVASREFAMSSKSKYKDGAWEFLRTFLLDEYQGNMNEWGFPLSIEHLDKMGEEAMKRPSYEDEAGNLIEYDETYYIGDVEMILEPMSAEEVEAFKEQLYSFDRVYKIDEELLNIIKEESAAYFSGQKTANDVANVIQSRAQIYVNETR